MYLSTETTVFDAALLEQAHGTSIQNVPHCASVIDANPNPRDVSARRLAL